MARVQGAVSSEEWLADTTDAADWFPAWLLLRHRGLIHLVRVDEVPAAGIATQVFRHLLSLLPLESQGLSESLVSAEGSSTSVQDSSATTWTLLDNGELRARFISRCQALFSHPPP